MNSDDPQSNIEIGSDTPPLAQILEELRLAQSDARAYYLPRMVQAQMWWRCFWPGQTFDGRKHSYGEEEAFPWDNSSDSRLRVVSGIVREKVPAASFAFWRAHITAKSMRPLVEGRERNAAQKILDWRIYTHMRG